MKWNLCQELTSEVCICSLWWKAHLNFFWFRRELFTGMKLTPTPLKIKEVKVLFCPMLSHFRENISFRTLVRIWPLVLLVRAMRECRRIWTISGMILIREKPQDSEKIPVPVPGCPQQISHGLVSDQTRASEMTGQPLRTWAMARPSLNDKLNINSF
jgi:hypothetical protein